MSAAFRAPSLRVEVAPVVIRAERSLSPCHYMAAEEALLADLDTYTEWLSAQCMARGNVTCDYVPRNRDAALDLIDTLTVPQLVAMTLYPSAEAAGLAMGKLRELYIAAHPAYLAQLADDARAWDGDQ